MTDDTKLYYAQRLQCACTQMHEDDPDHIACIDCIFHGTQKIEVLPDFTTEINTCMIGFPSRAWADLKKLNEEEDNHD